MFEWKWTGNTNMKISSQLPHIMWSFCRYSLFTTDISSSIDAFNSSIDRILIKTR